MTVEMLSDDEVYARFGLTPEDIDQLARPFEDGTLTDDDGNPILFEEGPTKDERPYLFDGELLMASCQIPDSDVVAVNRTVTRLGITKEDFLRNAILHELDRTTDVADQAAS